MSDVLDLSSAMPVDTAFVEILHPGTGAPTGWKIELAGPAHPKTVALGKDLSRVNLRRQAQIEAQQANGRKVKPDVEEPEDRARRNVSSLVARIIGWAPNPVFKNVSPEPIAFSEKVAVDLLLRPDMG